MHKTQNWVLGYSVSLSLPLSLSLFQGLHGNVCLRSAYLLVDPCTKGSEGLVLRADGLGFGSGSQDF